MNALIHRALAAAVLTLACSPCLVAQEAGAGAEETKTVTAGGLSFEVPASWKVNQPKSRMRLMEIEVPAAEGDEKPGELVLFAFPGGAGTVRMNVERWQAQFTGPDGGRPEIETETIKAGDAEITLVETAGRYATRIPEPVDEPGYRLLGGIYPTEEVGYFFKLVGPDATVKGARDGFRAMLESMKAAD